jgi:hypothetical protein
MKPVPLIPTLFAAAAAYDGLLGLLFLVVPGWVHERFGVPPPNHFGYVQFSALLLLIFAWMFVEIARHPAENRALIPYGAAMHLAYAGVVIWYWATTGLPDLWKPFAFADLVWAGLFMAAYYALAARRLVWHPSV